MRRNRSHPITQPIQRVVRPRFHARPGPDWRSRRDQTSKTTFEIAAIPTTVRSDCSGRSMSRTAVTKHTVASCPATAAERSFRSHERLILVRSRIASSAAGADGKTPESESWAIPKSSHNWDLSFGACATPSSSVAFRPQCTTGERVRRVQFSAEPKRGGGV